MRPGSATRKARTGAPVMIGRADALLLARVLLDVVGHDHGAVATIARRLGVSRSWLYSDPDFNRALSRARATAKRPASTPT